MSTPKKTQQTADTIAAALDAIAASLTRSVQQLSDAGTIDDAPSAELAAVGAFLLRYRREQVPAPVALHQTPMARAVIALSPADRIALAQEFEISLTMVDRWALGYTVPRPEIAARVERWCAARVAAGVEAAR